MYKLGKWKTNLIVYDAANILGANMNKQPQGKLFIGVTKWDLEIYDTNGTERVVLSLINTCLPPSQG